MRRGTYFVALAAMIFFVLTCSAQASSLDDAKTLAEKASAYAKANGKDKAVAEINNPQGQFVKGELFVVAGDFNGVTLANSGSPKLVGINLLNMKDPGGKLFMKDIVETAKTKGSGWVAYDKYSPGTKKVRPWKSWVQKVEGNDMWVMCGTFQ